jgi:hypothetical protein
LFFRASRHVLRASQANRARKGRAIAPKTMHTMVAQGRSVLRRTGVAKRPGVRMRTPAIRTSAKPAEATFATVKNGLDGNHAGSIRRVVGRCNPLPATGVASGCFGQCYCSLRAVWQEIKRFLGVRRGLPRCTPSEYPRIWCTWGMSNRNNRARGSSPLGR